MLTEYLKYLSMRSHSYFFDKMWLALKRAGNSVVAFGGSDKSRLVTASARSDVSLP